LLEPRAFTRTHSRTHLLTDGWLTNRRRRAWIVGPRPSIPGARSARPAGVSQTQTFIRQLLQEAGDCGNIRAGSAYAKMDASKRIDTIMTSACLGLSACSRCPSTTLSRADSPRSLYSSEGYSLNCGGATPH